MANPLENNVAQAIADLNDIQAAIEERGIEVGNAPTYEYGNLIRSIPAGEEIDLGVVVNSDTEDGTWVDITIYGDMYAEFMRSKTALEKVEFVVTTNILNDSFNGCTGLTSVTIPDSITSIGEAAFRSCTSVTEVRWYPPAVTSVGSSSWPIFEGCTNISKVEFGAGITHIPDYLFQEANDAPMGEVIIPETVTYIGTSAFYNCGLTSVKLPDGLSVINGSTFYSCDSLASVNFPENLTTINGSAFYGCTSLDSLTLPSKLTTIGSSAFYSTGITGELVIPASVTSVGGHAFRNCTGVTKLTWLPLKVADVRNGNSPAFAGCTGVTEVEFAEGIEIIPSFLCQGFTGLSGTLIIPDTVSAVGGAAFQGCTGLSKLVWLPISISSVQNGGYPSFSGCTGIQEVEFGEGIKIIPGNLCSGLTGLTGTLTIPETVTAVGSNAFSNCTGLSKLEWLPTSISSVGNAGYYPFAGCKNIKEVAWGAGITSIPDFLCRGLTGLEGTLTVPETVTRVGSYAFEGCTGLTKLKWLPTSISSVANAGYQPFANCTGIKEVEWADGITHIPEYICRGLTGLEGTVTIPTTVTNIGSLAFENCTGLTKLMWGPSSISSVQNWGYYPFKGCTNITTVDCDVAVEIVPSHLCYGFSSLTSFIIRNPLKVVSLPSTETFTNTPIADGTGYVFVPVDLLDSYQSSDAWASFASQFRSIEDYPEICG